MGASRPQAAIQRHRSISRRSGGHTQASPRLGGHTHVESPRRCRTHIRVLLANRRHTDRVLKAWMLNNDFSSRGIGKDRLLAFYTSTICGGYRSVPPPIMSTTPPAGASRERQCPDDSEHRRQCDNPCLAGGYDAPQVECAAWIPERNLTTPGRFLSRGRQRVGRLGGLDVEASEWTRPHLHRANELPTEPGGTAADHVGATDAAIADLLIRAYDEDFVPPQRSAWLGSGPGPESGGSSSLPARTRVVRRLEVKRTIPLPKFAAVRSGAASGLCPPRAWPHDDQDFSERSEKLVQTLDHVAEVVAREPMVDRQRERTVHHEVGAG